MPETPTFPSDGRQRASAGAVLATVLIALGLGTLLNAASLLETAERQPFDSVAYSLATGVMEPIAEFSAVAGFEIPRQFMERVLLGEGTPSGSISASDKPRDPAGTTSTTPATSLPPTTTSPTTVPVTSSSIAEPASMPTTTTASTTTTSTTTTTTIPVPTNDAPLDVWIIGDSFMEMLGPAIRNLGADTGVIEASIDFRFITGLTRPDYFDWPTHAREQLPDVTPAAVVVMFGGNDGQPFRDPEGWIAIRTPEWHERYGEVVGEFMDILLEGGAERIYWVGLPIMRSANFTEKVVGMNQVYRNEAEERPGVAYIASFEVFQDEQGEYSTYLRNGTGSLERMRAPDGAHLAWPGAYRLANVVLEAIAADWGVDWQP